MEDIIAAFVVLLIIITVFFLLPFWIMAVVQDLFLRDWSHKYWTIIQAQLIIGFLTNHNSVVKRN